MSLETLRDLPLVAQNTQPLDPAVVAYYQNNIALGSGPNGTYLLSDFFGSAAGLPGTQALTLANALINQGLSNGTLAVLDDIYADMAAVVLGNYGSPPDVIVPSGPAAGTYATYDAALLELAIQANIEIGNIVQTLGSSIDQVNSVWTKMAQKFSQEPANFARALVDYSTLPSAQFPVTAFIPGINGYGQDTQEGMSAQVLESVANLSNQFGQALLGALREGRNNQALDSAAIGRDNAVPDQPLQPPPVANLGNSQYTVDQARAQVIQNLSS
jgi:hypothetical protein